MKRAKERTSSTFKQPQGVHYCEAGSRSGFTTLQQDSTLAKNKSPIENGIQTARGNKSPFRHHGSNLMFLKGSDDGKMSNRKSSGDELD